MADDIKQKAHEWMLLRLRQRLRSARVNDTLEQWLKNPEVPTTMRFEFVLNGETRRALESLPLSNDAQSTFGV